MARKPETKELARQIRDHARRSVRVHGISIKKAIVRKTSPDLTVELTANDILVEGEHLLLGTWARWFDKVYGIKAGDTVLATALDDGDWFVIDVISQSDLDGLLANDAPHYTAAAFTWEGGNIVATTAYRDPVDGHKVGDIPIFAAGSIQDEPADV